MKPAPRSPDLLAAMAKGPEALKKFRERKRKTRREYYARHKHKPEFMEAQYANIKNTRWKKKILQDAAATGPSGPDKDQHTGSD